MMKKVLLLSVAVSAITSAAFAAAPVADNDEAAASQLSGTAPAAQAEGGVGDLVVTAQRREQAAQEIGIALTAFTGDELADKGISQVNALENITPNLEVESQFGSGQPLFSVRGVGFRDYATNNSPTVGIYVDEVNFPYPVMTQGVLFDVSRVEVLRGPQGTLYGRNTTGGAINVISNKPTDEFGAGLRVSYGSYDALDAEGFVSGPIFSGVRARLSGVAEQGGAWQKSRETNAELGDRDRYALRGLVEFDLSEAWSILLNLHGYQDKSDGLGLQLFQTTGGAVPGIPPHSGLRSTSWGISPGFAAIVGIAPDGKPFKDNQGFGGSVTLNGDFNGVSLTYVGAYENLDRREYNDFDGVVAGAAAVYFTSDINVMSHEVRLGSTGDNVFDWITGVFYAAEELDENYQSNFFATFGPAFESVRTPYTQEVDTIGVFGQVEYQFTERMNGILGLRYEDEQRDLIGLGTFANGFGTFNFANGSLVGLLENRSTSMSEVTGKVGVEFTLTDDFLFYTTVSRGVKSGGFTAYNTLNPNAINPFDPEEIIAYEMGFKSDFEFVDMPARLNAAIFYYDYEDQQVQSAIFDPGTGAVVGRIVNAPKSEIYGAEAELLWLPIENVTITQALGYKDGTFDEFVDLDIPATILAGAAVTIDRSGQDLGLANWSYSGSVAFEGPAAGFPNYIWGASLDYSYRDKVTPPLLGPVYKVEHYWLANARLSFAPADGWWEVALWGRNIFNTEYDETRNFFDPCCSIGAPGQPVTIGIEFSITR